MVDLSNSCIFSGATENLNTILTVKVEGVEYKVAVSAPFEEEASLGKIKELVAKKAGERNTKFEELQKIAKELGYDLSPNSMNKNSLAIPTKIVAPVAPATPVLVQPPASQGPPMAIDPGNLRIQKNVRQRTANEGLNSEEAEEALEAAKSKAERHQVHSPTSGQAPAYASHSLPERIETRDRQGNVIYVERPRNHATKLQVVRGREGMPVTIPKTITSSVGRTIIETNINVIDSGGERTVQNRFKALNVMNERGLNPKYLQQCGTCRGSGVIGKKTCSKCGGGGFLY